jgi:hypothetical protein
MQTVTTSGSTSGGAGATAAAVKSPAQMSTVSAADTQRMIARRRLVMVSPGSIRAVSVPRIRPG